MWSQDAMSVDSKSHTHRGRKDWLRRRSSPLLALFRASEWGGEVGTGQWYFRQPNGGNSGCGLGC